MLSSAQVALLQACTRVLVAPSRVVMTGRVSPDAEAAISGEAAAGVEVLVVDREGELAEYVRADLTHGERMLDAMAQVAQVGYFARRLARRRLMRQDA